MGHLDDKFPELAEKAKTKPKSAIKLFCYECMGGCVSDARTCTTKECPLWLHGPAAPKQKKELSDAQRASLEACWAGRIHSKLNQGATKKDS